MRPIRKNHLHLLQRDNQLTGIGGPGAPHLFEFSRMHDGGQGWFASIDFFGLI